ncbi:MAG: hypothetical protein JW867_00370 [Candidatus Omnitrophica bacterium]|nr:hypothetical protein [Candidatus Omnitrophota bacterium]
MKKVRIPMDELMDAFENCSVEHQYYWDTEENRMIFISEFSEMNEQEAFYEEVDRNPKRYIAIPERETRSDYNDMADFANTVEDPSLSEKLVIALDGKGAFRRFKNILAAYPEERQKWFLFKENRTKERINMWLEEESIEAIDVMNKDKIER